ncbi:MAG: WbqC family protein [Nitrospirales bacterium]
MMRVTIHQPQFLPWLGYLDKIDQADLFVVLDTVQYKKHDWQNRNRIRTAQGWQWLTVPTLHRFGQRIHEVRIDETSDWRSRHLRSLDMHYSRATHRDSYLPDLREVYRTGTESLMAMNLATVRWLLACYGIKTPIRLASEMHLREEPTARLIDICREVGATHYLAGSGAGAYLDLEQFNASGVSLEAQEFRHPEYPQCYEPFLPGMSAMDLLFTCGEDALGRLRNTRPGARPEVQDAEISASRPTEDNAYRSVG